MAFYAQNATFGDACVVEFSTISIKSPQVPPRPPFAALPSVLLATAPGIGKLLPGIGKHQGSVRFPTPMQLSDAEKRFSAARRLEVRFVSPSLISPVPGQVQLSPLHYCLSKLLPPSWLAYGLFCAQIYPSAHLRADALGFGSDGGPGRGFPSPDPPQEKRYGGGGGGFGGNGADACGKSAPFGGVGSLYGSISRPFHFGSGGGIGSWTGKTSDSRSPGGRAGGRIWIEWVGIVWINGRISADGGSSSCIYEDDRSGGGGSGGSCYVLAYSLQGAGAVSAVGGDSGRGCASLDTGGGGSGGRIAVYVKSDVSVSKIGTEWQGILSRKISMQIHGGRSGIYRNCTNGASGTAYRAAVWVVPGLGNPVVVNESKLILDSNMSSGSATDGGGSADNDSVAPAAITPIVPEARVDLLQCTACGALARNES